MKRPRIIRPEPKGDFDSRFVTLRKCKEFSGGNYELIGAELRDGKWTDLVKTNSGQSDWFDHATVKSSLTGYWNKPIQPELPIASSSPYVALRPRKTDTDESPTLDI